MNNRFIAILWAALAIGTVIFGLQAAPAITETITADNVTQTVIAATFWVIPVMILIAGFTILTLFTQQRPLRKPLAWLRSHAMTYWLVILLYICISLGYWAVREQPTNGRALTPIEFCYLCAIAWGFLVITAYDMNRETARGIATGIGKSRLSGVMVTLTTIIIILIAAEAYLRVFYITTDGYGFTAMNYHWYKNFYWGHFNSLGYRDYEPAPYDPDHPITRIAVVGDSFTAGHGISNIDDTFPQVLKQKLGAGYDVNMVAQSGWDSDVEAAYLNAYYDNLKPRLPNIVVLSYYLNDIDYLLNDPAQDPNAVFNFLQPGSLPYWVVLDFFVPNYVYYNVLQFTSPVRNTNFTDRLIRAHLDDNIWKQHEPHLQEFYQWTVDHKARLIVLLWPQIAAVKESQPALQRVRDFFTARGVELADMSPLLTDKNPLDMIVNRFDSHPSIAANKLAGELLYETITSH